METPMAPSVEQLETFPNPRPGRDYTVEIVCPEFTSMCPKTGQPDFGTIVYTYTPRDTCVELKSLKLYLQKFRNEGIFYEFVVNRLLDDFVAACQPARVKVEGRFTPRGGDLDQRDLPLHGGAVTKRETLGVAMPTWAGRRWQTWRAKARLLAPVYRPRGGHFFGYHRLLYPDLRGVRSELRPYDGLAAVWEDYARRAQPDYPPFLDVLAGNRGRSIRSVLDLGCGTGTLARRLAKGGREVVGLDISEPMIAAARVHCAGMPTVRLMAGDFRTMRLGRRFDAVVCGFNTLNYLSDPGELRAILQRVADHLSPGGLFLFDAVTDGGMRMLAGGYLHVKAGGGRFAIRLEYDAGRRRETAEVLLPAGVEVHRRVAIDPKDVAAAARATGLRLEDYFSRATVPGWLHTGQVSFYVLSLGG